MPNLKPVYPVYIISKGRADKCKTADFLIKDDVPFHIVIEPQEKELYAAKYGEDRLFVLPFSNLGHGSIPVRNWVKEHSTTHGDMRHWILDDNMNCIYRWYRGTRIRCDAGMAFNITENFIDRYTNVAIGGLNYSMFGINPTRTSKGVIRDIPPFRLNCHVYSCMLILNELPHRWRGRYNEDTDLCLQVLADGWCTIQMQLFLVAKLQTGTMKGGNTDQLYKDDGRTYMARSLEREWPGVVQTIRRFGRPQHIIYWQNFDNKLKRREDVNFDNLEKIDEQGLTLRQVSPTVKSKRIQGYLDEQILGGV